MGGEGGGEAGDRLSSQRFNPCPKPKAAPSTDVITPFLTGGSLLAFKFFPGKWLYGVVLRCAMLELEFGFESWTFHFLAV